MNSKHSAIIIIMQRLHQDDLTGYLLKRDNGVLAKTKEKWEHIVIPGIDKQGEALWPEMHDLEDYEEMKIKTPYLFTHNIYKTLYLKVVVFLKTSGGNFIWMSLNLNIES